ncbi:MAG: hypothetical protein U1E39_16360 [Planctomycetota bacterium]
MHIDDLRRDVLPTGCRVSARLVAEGGYAGPARLWYETDPAFADDLEAAPEAFLLAGAAAAMRHGEPRVTIDAPVCPRFVAGLEDVLRLFHAWEPAFRPVPVEPLGGLVAPRPRTPPRAALFLSGGVDSLSLLRTHRAALPAGHPAALADAFYLVGLHPDDVRGDAPDPERLRGHLEQQARLRALCDATGLALVPVRTNARALCPDFHAWKYLQFGPSTWAVAHLFRRRVTDVWLASHGYGAAQGRYSSHPLVDPSLSSAAVTLHTGEPLVLRQAKLDTVAAWPEGLAALQVCLTHDPLPPGVANCGRCEKCLRTRLNLLVAGALDRAPTFPSRGLGPDELASYSPASDPRGYFTGPLVEGLLRVGRVDLADALRRRLAHARRKARRRASWWGRALRRLRGRRFRGRS